MANFIERECYDGGARPCWLAHPHRRVYDPTSRSYGGTPVYEATFAMAAHAIRHIPVAAKNALVGVVSERDLFAIQRHGLHT